MEIELHRDPIKYILVRNWLDTRTLAIWRDYIDNITYDPGLYGVGSTEQLHTQVKLNNNCWLEPPNSLASEYQKRAWAPEIKQALLDMDDLLFRAHSLNNAGNFLVSKYDQGDYFRWHCDHTHYLTANFVLDSAEEGGDFELAHETESIKYPQDSLDQVLHTAVTMPNESNTLIIFPAMHYHRVTPVIKGQRRTIQYFLSRNFPKL
jgi:hypothetical protein